MRKPVRHTIIPGKRPAGFHWLGRLLALLAMLLNQPLAAIHAANDEEHLSHAAVHTAHLAGASHDDGGNQHGGPAHPDNLHHQTCQVCPLFGSALPIPVQAKITHASAWHHSAGPAAIQATKTEKRLRVGDPVRAPPPDHLI